MIISKNNKPSLSEFTDLVMATNDFLNFDAKKRENYYILRNAQKLEDDVEMALKEMAKGSVFEDTIQKISGQKFPDIVAHKYFGIEVKSSKDENWITLGGSVNESTRVEDVERIFLTFGKLKSPIEFRSRPYEECLSDVIVTHYPRYKINMALDNGETIFDKMKTSYDELRGSENPVREIVKYYKSQLKSGESLWWIDESLNASDSSSVSMKIRLWRTLSPSEKRYYMICGFAYFPNILGSCSTKYEAFTLWLVSQHGIVSTSMRDTFTAGGQGIVQTHLGEFRNIPQVICKMVANKDEIIHQILNTNDILLKHHWNVKTIEPNRIFQWLDLVLSTLSKNNVELNQFLKDLFLNKIP